MKKKLDQDVYISLILFVFAGWVFYCTVDMPSGAAVFPRLLVAAIAVFNADVLIKGLKKTKAAALAAASGAEGEAKGITWKDAKMPLKAYLFIAAFVILFSTVGYFIAAPLFFIGLMLFFKIRSWKTIIPVTAVYLIFIYIVFVWQLKVPLL